METAIYIFLALLLMVILLRGQLATFRAQKPQDYAMAAPAFNVQEHLKGRMICEGVIYGPMGRVTSTFSADFDMQWDGNVGVMTEHFRYNDGTEQTREWTITVHEDGTFDAEAPDVIGTGSGAHAGNAIRMVYNIRLPQEAGGHVLSTLDWMYLTPDGTVMNRSQFRKFGIKVAELIATIRKVEGGTA